MQFKMLQCRRVMLVSTDHPYFLWLNLQLYGDFTQNEDTEPTLYL